MKAHRKRTRAESLQSALDRREEIAAVLRRGGYFLRVQNGLTHWLVMANHTGCAVVQWWPSAQKWQRLPGGKIQRGSVDKFIEMCERTLGCRDD
jgi:hypothetical protein